MLKVFDSSKKKVGVFNGYADFLAFIMKGGHQNPFGNKGEGPFGLEYWFFDSYTPERLKQVCSWVKPGFLTITQLKALERKRGLLEIGRGDPCRIQQIPIHEETEIQDQQKKFCLDYARFRKWHVFEVFSPERVGRFSKITRRDPRNSCERWVEEQVSSQDRQQGKSLGHPQTARIFRIERSNPAVREEGDIS